MIQGAIWILRLGVFGTFIGHGVMALMGNESWLPYLDLLGIDGPGALKVMFGIGVVDILIGLSTLIRPSKYVLIYASCWAFCTALARPMSGEGWLGFVERTSNWAVPLALYLILYWGRQSE